MRLPFLLPGLRASACGVVVLGALALGVMGCARTAIGVRLIFPSERAFLAAALARIDVYDGGGAGAASPDAICRSLSVNPPVPPPGVTPIATSGLTDVCAFRAGGVPLEEVGVGRRVFFVEALDFESRAVVRGCTVVDVAANPEALEGDDAGAATALGVDGFVSVQLATLPDFPSAAPACASIEDKCEENVECRP